MSDVCRNKEDVSRERHKETYWNSVDFVTEKLTRCLTSRLLYIDQLSHGTIGMCEYEA